jgi:hypothetical protein
LSEIGFQKTDLINQLKFVVCWQTTNEKCALLANCIADSLDMKIIANHVQPSEEYHGIKHTHYG